MTRGPGHPPGVDYWQPGDVVVRREVVRGQVWSGMCMYVIEHTDDLLALYLPEGTPIGFGKGHFRPPTVDILGIPAVMSGGRATGSCSYTAPTTPIRSGSSGKVRNGRFGAGI